MSSTTSSRPTISYLVSPLSVDNACNLSRHY
nr:MAG TPA: hypothetical protein [Caudoviricetes sp.]